MKKSKMYLLLLIIAFTLFSDRGSIAEEKSEILFQTSIVDALVQGDYDGNITFGEIKENGDFGLGTLNHLDGELIGLDGVFYQVKSDGSVHIVTDDMKTPFAAVTFFESDHSEAVNKPLDCKEFEKYVLSTLPTQNIYYAIKVKGDFSYVKARSVPEQEKPYPPLTEVAKEEAIFEFKDINGTFVGYWLPEYLKDINVSGFHFHFLSEDKESGGHVLDCNIKNVEVEIDYMRNIDISLPDRKSFDTVNLTKTNNKAVKEVEENKQAPAVEQK